MNFEAGKKFRLKASKLVFTVINGENYIGLVEVKFFGDRETLILSANVLRSEAEELPVG